MLMCSRLNLCKSSVGTFTGTECIYKNVSTPPTWGAGFRTADPAILIPSFAMAGDELRSLPSSICSPFLPEAGGKIIQTFCIRAFVHSKQPERGCSYLCITKKSTSSVRLSRAGKPCPYDAQASIFNCCTRWTESTWRLLTWEHALFVCRTRRWRRQWHESAPPPNVTLDRVNAAVTHFQQPLPTWQRSSPSFPSVVYYDTHLNSHLFPFFFYIKSVKVFWSHRSTTLVLGGGGVRQRGVFSKAPQNLLQPSKEVITSTGFLCVKLGSKLHLHLFVAAHFAAAPRPLISITLFWCRLLKIRSTLLILFSPE